MEGWTGEWGGGTTTHNPQPATHNPATAGSASSLQPFSPESGGIQTKALCPVMARPTMRAFISREPS